jgi:hypothetical protein
MITNVILTLVAAAGVQGNAGAALQQKSLSILRNALTSEARWIKVHAAEALLAAGEREAVSREFERELAAHGGEPEYRIGIWRVLAQAASRPPQRDRWVRRIVDAFLDEAGRDRLHASETLGKLAYRVRAGERGAFERAARGEAGPLAANALWVLANNRRPGAEARLAALLRARDAATRSAAAYAVRYLAAIARPTWRELSTAVRDERTDDIVRSSLAAAAFVHAPASEKAAFAAILGQQARTGTVDMKSEVCGALAMAGTSADESILTSLLDDGNIDVRIGAARAIVQIGRRGRR